VVVLGERAPDHVDLVRFDAATGSQVGRVRLVAGSDGGGLLSLDLDASGRHVIYVLGSTAFTLRDGRPVPLRVGMQAAAW
jgi:hypothetical protein